LAVQSQFNNENEHHESIESKFIKIKSFKIPVVHLVLKICHVSKNRAFM